MNLSGSTGLDQSIDYMGTTQVAMKELGSANTALNSVLAQLNQKAGSNIKMADNINVGLKISGTFTSPNVSTNLADIAKSQANSLQGQASDFAKQKAKELEAQARAEADRLKKEAEDKLKSEADRLKKEAEAKAKNELDNLKKKAEEEAKKRLKGLFGN
jgi:regulator of protease activity HflC (stomatin/prohibitin superfamily)